MTQAYDVVLGTQGYMLVPPPDRSNAALGSYKLTVTPFKPAPVRTGIREWALPLDGKDASRWRADSMVNEGNGYGTVAGLVLGPAFRGTALTAGAFSGGVIFQGATWLWAGAYLFKVTLGTGNVISGYSSLGPCGGTITGAWVYNNRLWVALASPATTFASTDGATLTNAPGSVVAAQGFGYAQGNFIVSRTSATTIGATIDGGTTWTYLQTEGAIRAILSTGRNVLVAHAAGIDELTGSWPASATTFSGTLAPLVRTVGAGAQSDFAWMVDYEGEVYVWFAGTVCVLNRSTVYYGRLAPVVGAPRGYALAAVAAAGRLWVALVPQAGVYEIWSYDGQRWVRHYSGAGYAPYALVSVAGYAADADVLALNAVGGTVNGFLTSALGHTAYPAAAGSVTCGPWDADTPDVMKTWTEIEIVWNLPDKYPGAPSGTVLIETSVNGGVSFATAGTTTITSGGGGTIRQAVSVDSETLCVRVTWTPTANGTAFRLVSVYANGWELPATPPVRRWAMRVRCSDKLVRRDGTLDSRTGEQMRAALIALASTGAPVAFQDLDYDANSVSQSVRVIAIEETTRKGDGTHFWSPKSH